MPDKYCGSCIYFEIDEDGGYCNFLNDVADEAEESCEHYEEIGK